MSEEELDALLRKLWRNGYGIDKWSELKAELRQFFYSALLTSIEEKVKGLEVFTSYSDYDDGGVTSLEAGLAREKKGNNAGQAFGLGDERLVSLPDLLAIVEAMK